MRPATSIVETETGFSATVCIFERGGECKNSAQIFDKDFESLNKRIDAIKKILSVNVD